MISHILDKLKMKRLQDDGNIKFMMG